MAYASGEAQDSSPATMTARSLQGRVVYCLASKMFKINNKSINFLQRLPVQLLSQYGQDTPQETWGLSSFITRRSVQYLFLPNHVKNLADFQTAIKMS